MFTIKGCSLIRGVHYERFHCTAFQAMKKALVTAPTLALYDPSKPTALHTDASWRKRQGYAFLQKHAEKLRIIKCGSRFLTETESRYAMVELELIATTWAMKKCRIHLLGLEHIRRTRSDNWESFLSTSSQRWQYLF